MFVMWVRARPHVYNDDYAGIRGAKDPKAC